MRPKKQRDSIGDQGTEIDSLVSDYPPDPPPIDRFTIILAKVCGVLMILVAMTIIWDRYRPRSVVPVVETTTATRFDSPSGKHGFPTMGEFTKSSEPAPKAQLKISSKPKMKMASKKPSKKPIKRQRMFSSR